MTPALLDDELWRLAEPLLPVRERRFRYPGRKRLDNRRIAPVEKRGRNVMPRAM